MTFTADGKVVFTSGGRKEVAFFRREVLKGREERLKNQAPGSPDAKAASDLSKLFGPQTEMISFFKGTVAPANMTGVTFLWGDQQLLGDMFTEIYVRPNSPNGWRTRLAPGKREKKNFRPFKFLEGRPFVSSDGEGRAVFSWKGDWRSLVVKAMPELRSEGFDAPPVEQETASLSVSGGTIYAHRTLATETVFLVPEWRSVVKNGKAVGAKATGWVSVDIQIRPKRDIQVQGR